MWVLSLPVPGYAMQVQVQVQARDRHDGIFCFPFFFSFFRSPFLAMTSMVQRSSQGLVVMVPHQPISPIDDVYVSVSVIPRSPTSPASQQPCHRSRITC